MLPRKTHKVSKLWAQEKLTKLQVDRHENFREKNKCTLNHLYNPMPCCHMWVKLCGSIKMSLGQGFEYPASELLLRSPNVLYGYNA